jgi:arylsulfatase A-like enzyme
MGRAAETPVASRPNVIVLLIDDMGWKDLSCQGSGFYRTPHIDRLAASGVRFTSG